MTFGMTLMYIACLVLFFYCWTLKMKAQSFFKTLGMFYAMSNPRRLKSSMCLWEPYISQDRCRLLKDGGNISLWNVTVLLPDYTVSHHREGAFIVTTVNWVICISNCPSFLKYLWLLQRKDCIRCWIIYGSVHAGSLIGVAQYIQRQSLHRCFPRELW